MGGPPSRGHDDADLATYQVGGHSRQTVILALCTTKLHSEVLGGPSEAIITQMKGMGFAPPRAPKAEASTPDRLRLLWTQAGFTDIETSVLRARRTFDDFEDYWSTTIAAPNLAPMLTTMATADVAQVKSRVREQVTIEESGRVSIEARANAIVGRQPR